MKTEIDHLPAKQQGELERIKQVLMEEFARSIERSTKDVKRNGKILKIILFGSYARSDWVDEPENGYQSDFDLLVVVSHEDLTDIADHWYVAEDKILRDPSVDRTLNIIVHTLSDVNRALSRGEYFWVDILRDGIMLYELPNHPLDPPYRPYGRGIYAVFRYGQGTRRGRPDLGEAPIHFNVSGRSLRIAPLPADCRRNDPLSDC